MSAGTPPRSARLRPSLAWLTIRLTAILLAVLVLLHFAVTHVFTDVAETDSAFVAARWESGLVAATDWLMLVAAVVHGALGAWAVAVDHVRSPRRRAWVRGSLVALSGLLIAGGTATLLAVLGRA
jgi:succinate dehydrogenase / fumarate reductase membrane anchor subunit